MESLLSSRLPLARTVTDMAPAAPLDDSRAFMEWLVGRVGSQAELARRAALLPETVSDYVRGENEPKLTNVLKLLRGADVRIEGMPEREDPMEEAIRVLRHLEAELLSDSSPPPGGSEDV